MVANASSTAVPISVPPSQQWDGNDGPWSSFNIHVGTPAQVTRVLVSSTVGETWVISENNTQGGCLSTDPTTCPSSRGGLVNVNISSTWQDQGIYALGDEQNLPDYLDRYDNGDYGFDNLGIGQPGSGGVSLDGMVVAALATKDYYLGNLGVNQQPTNFSTFSDPKPSFLKSLKQSGKIPSLSWSYTAGNQYRAKKVFGSLTLGGSDTSRYTPNDNSFQFAGDISRDLVVGLQSITYSDNTTTNKPLLSQGILTFVDSTVPHIWLPVPVCQAFEKAFGITYNSSVNRYLVNETQHAAMQSQNASVSFILGNEINGGSTVNITFPYAAFDLTTGYPIVPNNTRYFPLRQAANDTQNTLGRTFLQEAYLTVDYERSNFSISQATFSSAQSTLLAIDPPTKSNPSGPPGITKATNSSSLPVGAIVGIVIAAILLLGGAAVGAFFLIRRKRRSRKGSQKLADDFDPLDKPEMDGQGKQTPIELFGPDGKPTDLKNSTNDPNKSEIEMEGSEAALNAKIAAEMEGDKARRHEMAAATGPSILTGRRVAEMEGEGDVPVPVEMYAGPHGLYELDSPVSTPKDGPQTAVTRSSAGLPTPTSASGLRSSDNGVPSPISPDERRSSGGAVGGRLASWTGRSKPHPRLPTGSGADTEDTSGISSQDEQASSSSSAGIWAPRRSSRPLGAGTAFKSSASPPQPSSPEPIHPRNAASGAGSGVGVVGESSRDRHRRGADALTKRLESSASLASSSAASSANTYTTPREGPSPLPQPADRFDSWNQRFGASPVQRGSDASSHHYNNHNSGASRPPPARSPRIGSEQSAVSSASNLALGGGAGRRPSEQSSSGGLMSPVSPAEEGGRVSSLRGSPRVPSPRVPSAAGGGSPKERGGRSPRPPDPPVGGVGGGGFF